jgi:cell division protein FtsZ
MNPEEFKEKLEVPAYMRKNVNLQDHPHSSERNISRFNLNDDNEILGNNKFLHDNVD